MINFTVADAKNLYGIDSWGAGYFDIDNNGFLTVSPNKQTEIKTTVIQIIEDLKKSRLRTPIILRFPQILESQVNALTDAFDSAIAEFQYKGKYQPVFPIKVNQQHPVVSALLEAGYKKKLGLEVGSKPELMAALGTEMNPEAIITCNGFKDREYFDMVSLGVKSGKTIVVIIEKPFELDTFFELAQEGLPLPFIGFRIKLHAKGSGFWEKSGGHSSKFGVSMIQLMHAVEQLKQKNLVQYLKMYHFHIGSQITEIRKIKDAIKEAAQIYAKSKKHGLNIEYLNVGGGLGVDYDGSKTSSDASVNYSVNEYANDVVYTIAGVCEAEHVPCPTIVSESGRFLVAYHSMLIVDAKGQYHEISTPKPKFTGKEPQVIGDMIYIHDKISVKNYREFYHDAVEHRDEMNSLFNLGMIEIEDRAKGEWLYWAIAKEAVKYSKSAKFVADEFVELEHRMFEKMVCNFSVFQSIPDHWALDQLFPIMPISKLSEKPNRKATLVDITCDSDGEVDKFVDLKDIKPAIEVHSLEPGEPYYMAFLMIGAYQDTMGDLHNLFGRVNEAHVFFDPQGNAIIKNALKGDSFEDTLRAYGYDKSKLSLTMKLRLDEKLQKGEMTEKQHKECVQQFGSYFASYPYLK